MDIKFCLINSLLICGMAVSAQVGPSITLQDAYKNAANRSPLAQQKARTTDAGRLAVENEDLQWLPQVNLNAQVTYQSAVTSFPVKLPNVTVEELSKDQYRGTIEVVQPVYDGGQASARKKLQQIIGDIETQRTEIELYQLNTKVNSYFFTVLLMDENISLMNNVQTDLDNQIRLITKQEELGIATKSNVQVLQVSKLQATQKTIAFKAQRKSAIEMLELLTGSAIEANTVFVKPPSANTSEKNSTDRPELKLFDLQEQQLRQQNLIVGAKSNPRISLFANGGYGRPGLNQLKNEFQWFYIGGAKLTVPITSHFTGKKERALNVARAKVVEQQRAQFLNTNDQLLTQQKNEIEKYQQLVESDSAIVVLRRQIRQTAAVQLANGIITSTEYITELDVENAALLNQQLHEIQWLQSQYNYKLLVGEKL